MTRNFRIAVVLLTLICSTVPVLIAAGMLGWDIYRLTEKSADESLVLMSRDLEKTVQHELDVLIRGFKNLALNRDVVLAATSSIYGGGLDQNFKQFQQSSPLVASLYIFNEGRELSEALPTELLTESTEPLKELIERHLMPDPARDFQLLVHEDENFYRIQTEGATAAQSTLPQLPARMLIAIHRLKDTKDNTLGFLVAVVPAANLMRSLLPYLAPETEVHLAINQVTIMNSINVARHYLQSQFTSELMVSTAQNVSIPIMVRVAVDPDILFHKVRARIMRVCLIVILVIITCGIAAFYFARSLLKPIHTLIPVIEEYSRRNYLAALPQFHYQEFVNLAVVLSDMSQSVREQEQRLETLVAERTLELQRKSNDMQTLLAHMPLGVLTIDGQGRIQPEYSRAAVDLVGEPWSQDASIVRGLLQHCGLTQDEMMVVQSVLEASVGQDPIAFDLNQHLLPRTLHFKEKILQVEWSPIVFDHSTQSILVTLSDTTAQRALEAEARKHGLEIAVSEEILGQDLAAVERFFQHHLPLIQRFQPQHGHEAVPRPELLRRLHTLKGNARTLGFRALAEATHRAEEHIIKEGGEYPPPAFLECWELYARAFQKKYRPILKTVEQRRQEDRRTLTDRCRKLLASWSLSQEPWHQTLIQCIQDLGAEAVDLEALLKQGIQGQAELCQRSDKLVPTLSVHGDRVLIPLPLQESVLGIFNHLITNSLVHGLESTAERVTSGKAARGALTIDAKLDQECLTLKYSDDGRGLPLHRIASLLKKPLTTITIQDIENWIFQDGHSTAEGTDHFAGRGLGMSAVQADIQSLGGSIHFVCSARETVSPYLTFALTIKLPWPDVGQRRWEQTA